MPRLIIGLGTGRCGTMSLSRLLTEQKNADVSHEYTKLPWDVDEDKLGKALKIMHARHAKYVGDVAHFWLNYVPLLDARVVCLQRDRESTIRSYVDKVTPRNVNHWMAHDGTRWHTGDWDLCYPKFEASSMAEAIGLYWDEYYRRVDKLIQSYPDRVRMWRTCHMNDAEKLGEMLDFVGIDPADKRVLAGICCNRTAG